MLRTLLCRLLRDRLGAAITVEIGSRADLTLHSAAARTADLCLVDIDLGDGSSVDWVLETATLVPHPTLVVMSSVAGTIPFRQLRETDASYVLKGDPPEELLDVIGRARAGAIAYSRAAAALFGAGNRDPGAPHKLLTPRELRILGLLGRRLSNADIAGEIGCAVATVADHRARIMNKLGLHRIEEVIDYALIHGATHGAGLGPVPSTRDD